MKIEKGSAKNVLNKIEGKKEFTAKDMELIQSDLKIYYEKIVKILREFMDLDEENYSLVACWIIGTYFHKQFASYPYLYFNAMKGSGKTRILKIISALAKNGKLVGSMTEAVLFRTAIKRSFCIDELEGINAKGMENLKLLLNSAYKKGLSVERMSKKKTQEGEQQVVEEFLVYCPIAMANIWGLGNVLSDRSISLILEKSNKASVVKLIENFESNMDFQTTKGGLLRITENLKDDEGLFNHIFEEWNSYIKGRVSSVVSINSVSSIGNVNLKENPYTFDASYTLTELFQKIITTNLSGRDLELFLPLFIIADIISPKILEKILKTSQKIVKLRKESDREENRDVQLYEFISKRNSTDFVNISTLVEGFKDFLGVDEKWINATMIGKGLRRLKLVLDHRSTGKARQVRLNIEKAKEKLLMFKEPEEIIEIVDMAGASKK